jgi:hypothetical protein
MLQCLMQRRHHHLCCDTMITLMHDPANMSGFTAGSSEHCNVTLRPISGLQTTGPQDTLTQWLIQSHNFSPSLSSAQCAPSLVDILHSVMVFIGGPVTASCVQLPAVTATAAAACSTGCNGHMCSCCSCCTFTSVPVTAAACCLALMQCCCCYAATLAGSPVTASFAFCAAASTMFATASRALLDTSHDAFCSGREVGSTHAGTPAIHSALTARIITTGRLLHTLHQCKLATQATSNTRQARDALLKQHGDDLTSVTNALSCSSSSSSSSSVACHSPVSVARPVSAAVVSR